MKPTEDEKRKTRDTKVSKSTLTTPEVQPLPVNYSSMSTLSSHTLPDSNPLQNAAGPFGDLLFSLIRKESWFESATLFHMQHFIYNSLFTALCGQRVSNPITINTKTSSPSYSPTKSQETEFYSEVANYIAYKLLDKHTGKGYPRQEKEDNSMKQPVAHNEAFPANTLRAIQHLCIFSEAGLNVMHDGRSEDAHDMVFRDRWFSLFCCALHDILYYEKSPILGYIRRTVLDSIAEFREWDGRMYSRSGPTIHAIFIDTDWRPLEFLDDQFGHQPPPLASIITYTGFVHDAFAATCSDYAEAFWPSTGAFFLRALQKAIDRRGTIMLSDTVVSGDERHELRLGMQFSSEGCLWIKATSSEDILVEVAQQTVWICSALRVASEDDTSQLYHCDGEISNGEGFCNFRVLCELKPSRPELYSCWQNIVAPTAVLCQHFPIPRRQDEMGLEVPLEMLCDMIGVRHAVEFEGGIVMKSVDSMLVPIGYKDNIVQWHFVSTNDDDQRFTYQDGINKCPNRALTDTVTLKMLQSARAIVGWCRNARKIIGREDATYNNIDYSTTRPFSSVLNFSGGSVGFQQFGAAQLNFTLGPKDTRVVFQRSGNFGRVLRWADMSHILLQDTEEKRAWLLNADDVILHIIQKRLHIKQQSSQEIDRVLSLLKYTNTAFETLSNNENWQASSSSETVGAMVAEIWSILEMLLDQVNLLKKTPDRNVTIPFQKEIVGFEFMSIVDERSPLETKQYTAKSTSGGWTRLIKDTGTLVLFAKGFQDLIKPESNSSDGYLTWQSLPKGEDYLGTTVPILMDLYTMAGNKSDLQHLTSSGLYWRPGNTVFEHCLEPESCVCTCNRLQDISHSDSQPCRAPKLEANGGVIFGKSSSYRASIHSSGTASGKKTNSESSGQTKGQSMFFHRNAPFSSTAADLDQGQSLPSPIAESSVIERPENNFSGGGSTDGESLSEIEEVTNLSISRKAPQAVIGN
ncbi:pfs domain [Fusarium longipes]|uniref:Pfs domain n=1 Tax=Fusarium longipes TaxID=694270 RepID=A0A395T8H4_9HYPO|nr:pfs domain [Fusarium longipes]